MHGIRKKTRIIINRIVALNNSGTLNNAESLMQCEKFNLKTLCSS